MNQSHSREDEHAARLAAIVLSSDDAIISKDLRGVITSWNPAAEKLFGFSAEEAIGRPITSLIVPPDRFDEEQDILARIMRGEAIEHFETMRRTKSGQLIPVSVSISPVRNAAGEVIGASKTARDMTERLRAEELRARLAAIVESSDDAIVSKTLDGIIQSWNRGAERLFGYSRAEAIGQHIRLIVPRDRWPEEDEVLAKVRRGERVEHFETVRMAKDGHLLDISLTVSPVRNAAGEIIGASKIARDITDRRRLQAERDDLLLREQAAREEAETLNRSKDQFLAVLSHEMRTPLNAIYGWARMIHDGRIDAALITRGTEVILRNAKAQLRLMEDLLDVSRIITGNMRLEVRPVDLQVVIGAALDSARPAMMAKELQLTTDLEPRGCIVLGAPERLQQVVWNLVANAVKFTPNGGGVGIRLRRLADRVELVVSDTGEGIGPDVLPYIFDRFRQGDSTTTRTHGGLGIGLSLVRHLVELHGGTVRAESPGVGRGATFTVTLPVSPSEGSDAVAAEPAAPTTAAASMLRNVRVLVVDDDVDSLELARVVLSDAGGEVRACTSAAAALDVLRDWSATVLVVDIEMPGMDGYELLRRVREIEAPRGPVRPVVALTAYANPDDRKRALAAGFTLYLAKPVDPAELTMAVAGLAGRRVT